MDISQCNLEGLYLNKYMEISLLLFHSIPCWVIGKCCSFGFVSFMAMQWWRWGSGDNNGEYLRGGIKQHSAIDTSTIPHSILAVVV